MVPLGAVLHNPPGSIGGRQPANTTMRPHMVVVVAPEPQHRAGMAERHAQRLVEALVTQAAVEALDIAVLLRLARRDVVPLDRRSEEHTSELQSLMRISYAVFCLKKKQETTSTSTTNTRRTDTSY